MAGPTRFEINGERHYATDIEGKAYPSVTTILGKTASEHAKKMLSNWNAKNPGGKEKAVARGTAIHAACENYIRGLPIDLPDEYLPFWEGLDKHLDKFDYFIWSEKPLKPEWNFCTGNDGISRLWSHQYGFCGCPDLIGYRNSLAILVDFKTSNQLLQMVSRQEGSEHQAKLHRLEQAEQMRLAASCLRPGCSRDVGCPYRLRSDTGFNP